MKLAVFIERDGILTDVRQEKGQMIGPATFADLSINQSSARSLARLKDAGYLLIATTNQPGLSTGQQSRRELDRIHRLLTATFALDDLLICPHEPDDECSCRKPRPGLLYEAGHKWNISLDASFVISHNWKDAAAARCAGCTSLLINSPWVGAGHRDFLVPDLATATEKILALKEAPCFVGA
jgi:D-glycero-D-manno-heptose 1,7-bisphosphate phosphatase